jgi:hypothetical protein
MHQARSKQVRNKISFRVDAGKYIMVVIGKDRQRVVIFQIPGLAKNQSFSTCQRLLKQVQEKKERPRIVFSGYRYYFSPTPTRNSVSWNSANGITY